MKKILFAVFTVMIVFSLTSLAFAHHPWVEKEGDKFVVRWGHPPKIDPYEPNRVKDIKGFDLKGRKVVFKRTDVKDRVYLSANADVSMITLSFRAGYRVTTPEGRKRMTRREAQKAMMQIVDSFYARQFAKSLFGYSNAVMHSVGMIFEIVPLKNPFSLKKGESLPVKVLYQGKPLAGVTVETGKHKAAGMTDENGIASVKISEDGMQVVTARYRVASTDPDVDFLLFITALTWEVK